jgi:hypothetical protein
MKNLTSGDQVSLPTDSVVAEVLSRLAVTQRGSFLQPATVWPRREPDYPEGGATRPSNLKCLCRLHNLAKHDRIQ